MQEGTRRRFGGLTPEKKALLKKIIMEKVREEMREEALKKKEEKERRINERIVQLPSMQGMTKGAAIAGCYSTIQLPHNKVTWLCKPIGSSFPLGLQL